MSENKSIVTEILNQLATQRNDALDALASARAELVQLRAEIREIKETGKQGIPVDRLS